MTAFLLGIAFAVIIIIYTLAFCRLSYLNDLESVELEKLTKVE